MIRKLLLTLALIVAPLGAAGVLVAEPSAHALTQFSCGSFSSSGPSVWAYGLRGDTYCTGGGSTYYIEATCIVVSANSWGYPYSTLRGSGLRGTSCDALDTPGDEVANGYLQMGCWYYWVDTTYYYSGANHDWFNWSGGSNYFCA